VRPCKVSLRALPKQEGQPVAPGPSPLQQGLQPIPEPPQPSHGYGRLQNWSKKLISPFCAGAAGLQPLLGPMAVAEETPVIF